MGPVMSPTSVPTPSQDPNPHSPAPIIVLNPNLGIQHEAILASMPKNLPPPISTPTGGSPPTRHRPKTPTVPFRSGADSAPKPRPVTTLAVPRHPPNPDPAVNPPDDIEQFSDDDHGQRPRRSVTVERAEHERGVAFDMYFDIVEQLSGFGVQRRHIPDSLPKAYWLLQRYTERAARDEAEWKAAQVPSTLPVPATEPTATTPCSPTPVAAARRSAPGLPRVATTPAPTPSRPQRANAGKRKSTDDAPTAPTSPPAHAKKRIGTTIHRELNNDTWSGRMFANRRISYTSHPDLDSPTARPHGPVIPNQPTRDVSHVAALHLFATRIHNRMQHAFPPDVTLRLVNVPGDGNCQLHAIAAGLDVTRTNSDPLPVQALALRNVGHQELVSHPDRYQPWFAADQQSTEPATSYQEFVDGVLYEGRQEDQLMLAALENALRINLFVLRRILDHDGTSNRMAYQETSPHRPPGRESWPALILLFVPSSPGDAASGHYMAVIPSRIDLLPGPRQRLLTAVTATDEFITNAVRNRLYALSDSASVSSENTASPTSMASAEVDDIPAHTSMLHPTLGPTPTSRTTLPTDRPQSHHQSHSALTTRTVTTSATTHQTPPIALQQSEPCDPARRETLTAAPMDVQPALQAPPHPHSNTVAPAAVDTRGRAAHDPSRASGHPEHHSR
jgi:hypothetical protein